MTTQVSQDNTDNAKLVRGLAVAAMLTSAAAMGLTVLQAVAQGRANSDNSRQVEPQPEVNITVTSGTMQALAGRVRG